MTMGGMERKEGRGGGGEMDNKDSLSNTINVRGKVKCWTWGERERSVER